MAKKQHNTITKQELRSAKEEKQPVSGKEWLIFILIGVFEAAIGYHLVRSLATNWAEVVFYGAIPLGLSFAYRAMILKMQVAHFKKQMLLFYFWTICLLSSVAVVSFFDAIVGDDSMYKGEQLVQNKHNSIQGLIQAEKDQMDSELSGLNSRLKHCGNDTCKSSTQAAIKGIKAEYGRKIAAHQANLPAIGKEGVDKKLLRQYIGMIFPLLVALLTAYHTDQIRPMVKRSVVIEDNIEIHTTSSTEDREGVVDTANAIHQAQNPSGNSGTPRGGSGQTHSKSNDPAPATSGESLGEKTKREEREKEMQELVDSIPDRIVLNHPDVPLQVETIYGLDKTSGMKITNITLRNDGETKKMVTFNGAWLNKDHIKQAKEKDRASLSPQMKEYLTIADIYQRGAIGEIPSEKQKNAAKTSEQLLEIESIKDMVTANLETPVGTKISCAYCEKEVNKRDKSQVFCGSKNSDGKTCEQQYKGMLAETK